MKTVYVALVLSLSLAAAVSAQAALTSYTVTVRTSQNALVRTDVYPVTALSCNQLPLTIPATVLNPTKWVVDDPINGIGRVCVGTILATTLALIPNGTNYTASVTVTDSNGLVSAGSAASNPFSVQGAPLAPTGLKVAP